jgi:beta-glucanase (GH16 family)
MCARRKTRVATPTRSQVRSAGSELGVAFFVALASVLSGCGSKEPLVLGSVDFVLERHDDFDSIDPSYWELATHTFDDNLAWFTEANATIEDGYLTLSVTKEQTPAAPEAGETPKPYAAAELRTRTSFLYGRYRTRARLTSGTGVISAFWGFYDRYASMGEQIDNQIVIEGTHAPEPLLRNTLVVPDLAPEPELSALSSDPADGYHIIGYDWTPSEVRFYYDDVVQSVITGEAAAALTQYQRLVLSAYPSKAGWVGAFDDSVLPVTASFDWVEIYSYPAP